MTIPEEINMLKEEVAALKKAPENKEVEKKKFEFKIKIPSKVVKKSRKDGVFAVLMLRADKEAVFTNGQYIDGLLSVDGQKYSYETGTVFWIKKRKIPLVVLYEWRLTPIAGDTDILKQAIGVEGVAIVSEKEDHIFAKYVKLLNYGQQTIIRSIQQAQLPDLKTKLGGSAVWYFIGGVIILYFLSEFMKGV